uniref:Uncharacterized protein n=1 Tax=Lactuca sativa TaxID=4236 RepID=A0A9R1X707_LACSA|nr:hypothetical protein LSAT_V11C600300750 [Lactuca sativa]
MGKVIFPITHFNILSTDIPHVMLRLSMGRHDLLITTIIEVFHLSMQQVLMTRLNLDVENDKKVVYRVSTQEQRLDRLTSHIFIILLTII